MHPAILTAIAISAGSAAAISLSAHAEGEARELVLSESISLSELRWQARPILIFAEPGDPRLTQQLAQFEAARADLEDRENIVIVDTAKTSSLRDRFAPQEFTIILIGKDGGEKMRRNGIVDPEAFNALIDTMPMRRQEVMRQGS